MKRNVFILVRGVVLMAAVMLLIMATGLVIDLYTNHYPLERLAGFAGDNPQPVALRHEAQTVLTLFEKRRDDLDARDAVRDPEVTTLGMLMIVPRNLMKR